MIKRNIIILILLIVFVGILFLLDFPAYNNVAFNRNELKIQKEALKDWQELIAKTGQLKEMYSSREQELSRVGYFLPTGKDVPSLIVQLEALASENGLLLEKIDFIESESKKTIQTQEPQKPFKSMGVSLKLTGTYQSFKSFLEALELNIRLMDVKTTGFSSQKENKAFLSFDISLEVYYQ